MSNIYTKLLQINTLRTMRGTSLVVSGKNSELPLQGHAFDPWSGTKILHALQHSSPTPPKGTCKWLLKMGRAFNLRHMLSFGLVNNEPVSTQVTLDSYTSTSVSQLAPKLRSISLLGGVRGL